MRDVIFTLIVVVSYRQCFSRLSAFKDFFATRELFVVEGGRSVISNDNIRCKLVNASSIKFIVISPPRHGIIIVDQEIKDQSSNSNVDFTLQDLLHGKVFYYHNGNEEKSDQITINVYVSSNNLSIDLPVKVNAVNDPPILHVMRNIKMSTQLRLTTDIITAYDADNEKEELIFTYEYENVSTSTSVWIGRKIFSNSNTSNSDEISFNQVDKFTYSQIVEGEIFLVHSGPPLQNLKIRVTDGQSSSLAEVVTIEAHLVKIHKVAKTTLQAIRGIGTKITTNNLNFLIESDHDQLDVVYYLREAPNQGDIQVETGNNQWGTLGNKKNYWNQRDILEGKVRYMHVDMKNDSLLGSSSGTDVFKFVVSCLDVELPEETFKIEVVSPKVIVERNTGIDLIVDREGIISDKHLLFSSNGTHSNESIFYKLMATPFYGDLKFKENRFKKYSVPLKKEDSQTLGFESNFTQLDLNEKKLIYRLRETPPHAIVDNFQFAVFVPGFQSGIQKFQINYFPAYPPKHYGKINSKVSNYFRLINNGLFDVFEGLSKQITTKDLCIEPLGSNDIAGYVDFLFKIATPTSHGTITRSAVEVQSFTLSEIKENLISYVHDDSENDFDFFDFIIEAVDLKGHSRFLNNMADWMTESSGTLEIFIILRNDNEPFRVLDRQIIVTQEMNRVLTSNDIWFNDADSDFNVSDLQYEIKNMSNIYFYHCNATGRSIERFTQKDIGNGDICINHYGPILGENILSVTDGTFIITTTLNVRAEPIYLKVAGGEESRYFSKFSQVTITDQNWILLESKHFAIESNILSDGKYTDDKIFFFILTPPTSGELRIGNDIAWQFTMSDIELKRIKLHVSLNKSTPLDFFRFLLRIGAHSAIGLLNISVESDESLSLQVYKKISFVDLSKSKSIRLDAETFDFLNSVAQPEDISIVVKSKPLHGRLSLGDHRRDVNNFMQNDIYDGKLTYVTALNESHLDRLPLNDSMTFQASCCSGLFLRNMLLIIEIRLQVINLTSVRLSVMEGGAEILAKNLFQFNKKLFSALDIFVVEGPFRGHFVSIITRNSNEQLNQAIDISNHNVTRFSTRQIENKRISYVHDGSEMGSDYFVVVGKSFDSVKISEFVRVEVDVIPINNKLPVVISSNNLNVEKESWTLITEDYILIGDEDTSDDKIVWKVFNVSGGFIVSRNISEVITDSNPINICDPSKWTNTRLFTQSQVISKQVAFVAQELGEHLLTMGADDGRFTIENITIKIIVTALNFSQFTFKPLLIFPGFLQKVELNRNFLERVQFHKEYLTCPPGLFYINYRILRMPHRDQIIFQKYGSPPQVLEKETNFTLTDVIKGNIYYQSASPTNEFSIYAKDELIAEIYLSSSQSNDESKQIATTDVVISLLNINERNIHKLITIKELIVKEGGRVLITPKHLNNENLLKEILRYRMPVTPFYTVTELPKHGLLYRNNKELSLESIFYQSDIDDGKIEYRHDDSESSTDHVKFKIFYSFNNEELKSKHNTFDNDSHNSEFSLTIRVSQKDGRPFQLIVQSPSIELVQGTHKTITTDYLSISDKDIPHEKIIYEIINQPSNCKFILLNKSSYYSVFEDHYFQNFNKNLSFLNNEFYLYGVTSFKQSDIDNKLLLILHDSKSSNHDAFYFSVTDGSHPRIFKIFYIKIEPLTIKAKTNSTELEIIQADIRAIITRRILDIETNGDRKLIRYFTTKGPEFGLIFKNNTPVDYFTQADVDEGIVSYIQTNFSSAIDYVTVALQQISEEFVTIKISVTPIQSINYNSPTLKPGEKLIFTTLWLDARTLAYQTDSDPVYEVFKLPTQGVLKLETDVKSIVGHRMSDYCDQNVPGKNISSICFNNVSRKIQRGLTKLPNTPNSYFTFRHSDILSKRVSYTADPTELVKHKDHVISNHITDDFDFVLSAPRAQRILVNFKIQIAILSLISNQTLLEMLSKPNEINSEELESESDNADSLSTSNDVNDRLKIIGSIIFVVIIFAAAFIVYKYIKCYQKRKCQKETDRLVNNVTNKNEDKGHVLSKSNSSTYPAAIKEQITNTMDIINEPDFTNTSGLLPHIGDINNITKDMSREDCNKFSNEISEEADKSLPKLDNRQSRLFDWKKIDPELLQHCRKTTPVLHTNQYWV